MSSNKEVEEKLSNIIEAFCDMINSTIPQGKEKTERLLTRMKNVGFIDHREYDTFYEYLNREED